jgi:gluconolactonase
VDVEVRSSALSDLLAEDAELELLGNGFDFTEGPVWNAVEQCLLFSDVSGDVIRRWDTSGVSDWRRPSRKANGLTYDPQGRLVACEHVSSTVTRTEHDGSITTVASHWEGKELNSPNDVAVKSDGAVYFTDPSDGRTSGKWGLVRPRQIDFHGVYMVPAGGGETVLLVDDFVFPNGLCFSPDERILYVNDTTKMHIRAFDVRPDGTIENGRLFAEQPGTDRMEDGVPDGLKADERGNLWATGPFGVWVISPEADVLGIVKTPAFASNLNWGAPGWSALYVTVSDAVYRLQTNVRGGQAGYMAPMALQALATELLERTRASRATIRVDDTPGVEFPVKAEARVEGVHSIAGDNTIPIRESATFKWMDRERRILVQEDLLKADPAPAADLMERYGGRAQMLAPIEVGGELVGLVSVHHVSGPRTWMDDEVRAVEDVVARVRRELGEG